MTSLSQTAKDKKEASIAAAVETERQRGRDHYREGEYFSAIFRFSEAIALDPWLAIAYTNLGNIRFRRKQFYLSTALAYQYVGVREEDDGRWLVTFMNLDLGHLSRSGFAPL